MLPSAAVEDKPQSERKVIATAVQGIVKWFNVRNGYGFINRTDTKEDVFVHQTAIKKNNPRKFFRSVGDGEIVEFDVIEAAKGSEATNVTGPGGVPVKGSRYAPNKRRFRRRLFPRTSRPGDQSRPADGQASASEADGSGEADGVRPPLRRRRPRRLQQEGQDGEGEEKTGLAEGDQMQRPPRRRFWRPYRRQSRPRSAPNQPAGDQQAAAPQTEEQVEVKQTETSEESQTNSNGKDKGSKRQLTRPRKQRNSESSTSKNDTKRSVSEPGTPPQTSKSTELKSTPKSPKSSPRIASPITPQSSEQAAATTVPAPTE